MFNSLKKVFGNIDKSGKLNKLLEETTVLFVDKDFDFSKDVKLHLENYVKKVYLASDGAEAIEIFNTHKPDIVISEITIPSIDGIELSKIIKNVSVNFPVILISDFSNPETLQKIVDIKIEKFISKPIYDLNILFEAIEKIAFDMKNKTLKDKMECTEILDPLTGVYNRTKLNELLSLEINKYKRFKTNFSLIVINPDNFQKINTKYGHKIGDEVLKDMAKLLSKNIRSIDIFGRWSNNEFIIILPQTDANGATKLANNIREKILKKEFQKGIKITASFGVVKFKDDDDIFSLIKRLEDALKKSKNSGKNRVTFW